MESRKENKMGTMPVNRLLVSMSLPIILSMLVQALYNIVDSIFVSRYHDNALTAVTMAFPVQILMIALSTGTGVGINALLSYNLGQHNQREVNESAKNGIFLGLLSSLLFTLFGLFGSRVFYTMQFSAEEYAKNPVQCQQIIDFGTEYLQVVTIFCLGLFMQITLEKLLQATGKTVYSMLTQCFGAIINIILDYVLIFGKCGLPAMGPRGAALATVIGQWSAMILCIIFNRCKNKEIQFAFRGFRPNLHIIGQIYRVGLPSIIMQAISSFVTYFMNGILLTFSKSAVDVYGIYFKLQSFIFMPVFGLNNGMIPILAYNYGARKKERITQTLRLSYTIAIVIMTIGTIVFLAFPKPLLRMFSSGDEAFAELVQYGVPALRIISIHFIVAGYSIVCTALFQAMGNGLYSMIISICRQILTLLPLAYLMGIVVGSLDLVWFSYPIAEIVSAALCTYYLIRTYQKQIKPLTAAETV